MAQNFLDKSGLPLGLRNNNPGNLRPLATGPWVGEISPDTKNNFSRFKNIAYGIRAMATNLVNQISNRGNDTIRKLITSYAPPSENDTNAYINAVSRRTGWFPDAKIPLDKASLENLVRAIMEHELGKNFADLVTVQDVSEGIALMNASILALMNEVVQKAKDNPGTTALIIGFFFSCLC